MKFFLNKKTSFTVVILIIFSSSIATANVICPNNNKIKESYEITQANLRLPHRDAQTNITMLKAEIHDHLAMDNGQSNALGKNLPHMYVQRLNNLQLYTMRSNVLLHKAYVLQLTEKYNQSAISEDELMNAKRIENNFRKQYCAFVSMMYPGKAR